jgi:hypothetical protein
VGHNTHLALGFHGVFGAHSGTVSRRQALKGRTFRLVHHGPSVTRERYDEIVHRMIGKDRVESPADWPVEGLLVHAAGQGPDGFRIVDVSEPGRLG